MPRVSLRYLCAGCSRCGVALKPRAMSFIRAFKLNPSSKFSHTHIRPWRELYKKLLLTPEVINFVPHFLTLWKSSMVQGSWAKARANVLGLLSTLKLKTSVEFSHLEKEREKKDIISIQLIQGQVVHLLLWQRQSLYFIGKFWFLPF